MAEGLIVNAFWDEQASVWVATSEDVPGLITEAPSVDALVEKLSKMIPELLALNGDATRPLIVHNIGWGTRENDMLFDYDITGHYRPEKAQHSSISQ